LVLTIPRRRLAAPRPAGAGQELRSSYLEGKAAEAPAKIGARARSMARRRQGSARARNRGEECARHFARAREGVRGALRSPGLAGDGAWRGSKPCWKIAPSSGSSLQVSGEVGGGGGESA
ncbi:unnamed protein product, partial [Prorocentrum cordatum]